MFRESDFVERKIHPSYTSKPIPTFQFQCQSTKFVETQISPRQQTSTPLEVEPIPTTFDTFYDPSHPDADWSGLVSKKGGFQRKHCSDHISQRIGIIQDEKGIISVDERQEFPRRRRISAQSENDVGAIIGGIDTDSRYQTNYRSLADHENTSRSQLILSKRQLPRKRLDNPAQAKLTPDGHVFSKMSQYLTSSTLDIGGIENDTLSNSSRGLVGYRAPRAVSKSLLSNVGANILDSVQREPPMPSPRQSAESYKTNKVLITDIYNTRPGYTGHRPF